MADLVKVKEIEEQINNELPLLDDISIIQNDFNKLAASFAVSTVEKKGGYTKNNKKQYKKSKKNIYKGGTKDIENKMNKLLQDLFTKCETLSNEEYGILHQLNTSQIDSVDVEEFNKALSTEFKKILLTIDLNSIPDGNFKKLITDLNEKNTLLDKNGGGVALNAAVIVSYIVLGSITLPFIIAGLGVTIPFIILLSPIIYKKIKETNAKIEANSKYIQSKDIRKLDNKIVPEN